MSSLDNDKLQIKKLQLGPFGTNCYVLICPQTKESIIIDTPAEPERLLDEVKGTNVKQIVITHTHRDHLGAFEQVVTTLKAPVGIHPSEASNLPIKPDVALNDGDIVKFGEVSARVLHTPGHTAGGICLLIDKHLFSGDTIFTAGPGKTGSPAALQQIIESITSKIFVLPEDTAIYPGHGPTTVLGKEKKEFEVFSQRGHDPRLCGDVVWLTS